MKKGSGRRRVKTNDEDDGDSGPTILSRSSSSKKKSKLSFSNDFDGGDDDGLVGMKGVVMKRDVEEEEKDFLAPSRKPIVLSDLASRPSYSKEELSALRSDSMMKSAPRDEPVIVHGWR
jgi:hypothetical protein